MNKFKVITYNIKAGLALTLVLQDLRRLLQRKPGVIGFQEIGGFTRAAAMRVAAVVAGYHWSQRITKGAQEVPMVWHRKTFKKIRVFRWWLSPATRVGKRGAGPKVLREKSALVAVLRHRRSREQWAFINCHLAPSIRLPLQPDGVISRGELHAMQIQSLSVLISMLLETYPGINIVLMGDFNTERREYFLPILNHGMDMGENLPTHGPHSAIDKIITNAEESGKRHTIIGHSDHRALESGEMSPAAA